MGKKFKGGFIGDLDESQKEALAQMHQKFDGWKAKVDSWGGAFRLNDRFLLKFLRARDFDIEKASRMLEEHLEFREKWLSKPLSPWEDPDLKEALDFQVWRLAGQSKQGHQIQMIEVGKFLPKRVKSMDQYIKTCLFEFETTFAAMARNDWKTETSVVLFDMQGWSLFVQGTPSGMAYTRALVDIVQNHYPETLEKAIIFNAPLVFRGAWAIIRPWLDPATAARVVFVTDPLELHEFIDPDQLNERYGGTKKDEYEVFQAWMGPVTSPKST